MERAHADYVGLSIGGCHHLSSRLRMDSLRNLARRHKLVSRLRIWFSHFCLPDSLDHRVSDLSWTGMGLVPGYCRSDAGDAATNARSRGRGCTAICRRFLAADSTLRNQHNGLDADGELHLDARLCL